MDQNRLLGERHRVSNIMHHLYPDCQRSGDIKVNQFIIRRVI